MAAFSQSLPYALAIALGGVPIVVIALVLATTRQASVSWMFLLGWAAGILAVTGIIVALVDTSVPPRQLSPVGGGIVRLILGAVVGLLAVRSWQARGTDDIPPKWLSSAASWSAQRALAIGFTLGSVNPKNLALSAAGATAILGTAASHGNQVFAVVAFAVVGSLAIAAPIALQAVGGDAVKSGLERARAWMEARSRAISTLVLAVIAVVLVVAGVAALR